ncbi:phage major capsid protein, partial [Streptococcus pneumoniae]|nr:phage major capsid protein [Streptococcus pneumoniae]
MKTLVELMEERQKHADELSEIKFKKASIEEKLESATIGEEELAQLKSDAEGLVSKADELKNTISKLDVEIEEKQDNLNKAAKSIKEVQKGKIQMEYLKT